MIILEDVFLLILLRIKLFVFIVVLGVKSAVCNSYKDARIGLSL